MHVWKFSVHDGIHRRLYREHRTRWNTRPVKWELVPFAWGSMVLPKLIMKMPNFVANCSQFYCHSRIPSESTSTAARRDVNYHNSLIEVWLCCFLGATSLIDTAVKQTALNRVRSSCEDAESEDIKYNAMETTLVLLWIKKLRSLLKSTQISQSSNKKGCVRKLTVSTPVFQPD